MIFNKTEIEGLYVIETELKSDERGYFSEIFTCEKFLKEGLSFSAERLAQSLTKKRGTIRGIHFQKEPKAEIKIVQCLKGAIYDVAIDLRPNSLTYRKWFAQELSEKNKKLFFIPKGFAHGFQTLTGNCQVQYLISGSYSPENAGGVRWNDPLFNIKWPIKKPTLSEKDKSWHLLHNKN